MTTWISEYTVCPLPRDHPFMDAFAVRVENIGPREWIVKTNNGPRIWPVNGARHTSYRFMPDDEKWRTRYVTDLVTALSVARTVASSHTVNGSTALDVLAKEGESIHELIPDPREAVVPGLGIDPKRQAQAGESVAGLEGGPEGTVSTGDDEYHGRHRRADKAEREINRWINDIRDRQTRYGVNPDGSPWRGY